MFLNLTFTSLLFLSVSHAKVEDITKTLTELQQESSKYEESCQLFFKKYEKYKAVEIKENGPELKSKEKAMRAVISIREIDPGIPRATAQAYALLEKSSGWEKDQAVLGLVAKLSAECKILNKHELFSGYAQSFKKLEFTEVEKKTFSNVFMRQVQSGLEGPMALTSLLLRLDLLSQWGKAGLWGRAADAQRAEEAHQEFEGLSTILQSELKSKGNYDGFDLKRELELSDLLNSRLKEILKKSTTRN